MASYDTPTNRLRIVPPNVASIERYGSVPINFSSGQLNYSVPLHSIDVDNELSLPIQLTYNNTGLKPDEVPTWVGNGWDLHLGGSIVQTIRSVDDFEPVIGLQVPAVRQQINDFIAGTGNLMAATDRYIYCNDVVNNHKDSQFDVFSFSLPGRTGKFYFDGAVNNVPKAVLYNQQPIRINFVNNQFTITDERGTIYAFTESIVGSESFSTTPYYTYADPYSISSKTWYLTKITTAAGVAVTLSYKPDASYLLATTNYSYSAAPNQGGGYGQYMYGSQSTEATVSQNLVTQIAWKGKRMTFETIDRNDLYATDGVKAQALSKIKLYNERNELVRQIGFTYDNGQRLQLKGLAILDKTTGDKVQEYTFDYYGSAGVIPVPHLRGQSPPNPPNNAIDHWGYYNGKPNASKIPRLDYTTLTPSRGQPSLMGDRSSDGSFSRFGMLRRITYPTRGYTEITYEPNRVSYPNQTAVPTFMGSQDVATGYSLFLRQEDADCNQSQPVSGQFNVPQLINGARISWQLMGTGGNRSSGLTITGPTGQVLVNEASIDLKQGTVHIDLPAGTYSYNMNLGCQIPLAATNGTSGNQPSVPLLFFTIEQPVIGTIDLTVGGNRVMKVVDYDQTTGYNERNITYDQATLLNEPMYLTSHETPSTIGSANACISIGTTYVINERSVYGWDGFHLSYRLVTEALGQSSANGRKVYTFDDSYYLGQSFRQAPYPPAQNLTWRSDSPQDESSFRKNPDGSFELVAKSSSAYTQATLNVQVNGIKIERTLACPDGSILNPDAGSYFSTARVPVFTDHYGVASKVQEQWFGTNVLSQTTTYGYNEDWLVNKVATINSKNQPEETLTYYANDYEGGADSHIAPLKTINAIGIPLKMLRTVNGQAVEGVLTKTDAVGNPVALYRLDIAAPVTLTHDRNSFLLPGFNLLQSRQYSSQGNLTQLAPRNGPTRTYVWGYNHTYPIADVANATQSQVEATSGVGSLETVATLTDDAAVRAIGSTLRSGLPQSLVTSTVMQSGVGVSQLTGPSGLNTGYVYDGINRLATISDNNNNIVKAYAYNYRPLDATSGSPNQPPGLVGMIPDQTASLNQAFTYTLPGSVFSDPEGQALTYTITNLPAGLTFAGGIISGTPTTAGKLLVTLTATDPGGLSGSTSFNITVSTCFVADPYIVTGTFSSPSLVTISAVNHIETDATQAVLVNPNAALLLKAGQSVRLKAGFVIKAGASFRAITGPCN